MFSYIAQATSHQNDLLQFRDRLHKAILHSLDAFRREFPTQTIYGFAIAGGQSGNYLGYQLMTEERLTTIADYYYEQGYRYKYAVADRQEHHSKLREWMRWQNPEDDWYMAEFDESLEIRPTFQKLVERQNIFGEYAEHLVQYLCDDVLATLHQYSSWIEAPCYHSIILGVASDEADFLTCCARCNPYHLAITLRGQKRAGEELDNRIMRPEADES
jgi:hypothetical protein